jgi:hypothetical protein
MKLRREGSIPRYGFLVVGAYCWSAAVVFGAELLDVVYSRAVSAVLEAGQLTRVFSGVSDLLLLMFAATVCLAIGAIGAAWGAFRARVMLLLSIGIIGLGLLAVMVLGSAIAEASLGPVVRLSISGSASAAAVGALITLQRSAS